jgi:hypothetical protein
VIALVLPCGLVAPGLSPRTAEASGGHDDIMKRRMRSGANFLKAERGVLSSA